MLSRGAAKKVTIYVNEDTHYQGDTLWSAIVRFLRHKHVAGATAFRPMTGFGAHEILHSSDREVRSEHMPIRVEFIDSAERVDELLPTLYAMVEDGVIEVQDTNIVKAVMKDSKKPAPHTPHNEIKGPAKMLRIYLGEADRLNGEPLFEVIVNRLMMMEAAGATVYRGFMGYGVKRHQHKEGLFRISKDAPILISVVDQASRVDEIVDAIAPIMQDGLFVISDVDVRRFVHALPEQKATNAPATAR
jgi:PII-like signaling protein